MPRPLNISASRSAAILGQSNYQTPVQVWLQIMGEQFCQERGYTFPVIEDNAAMKFGREMEHPILQLTEKILKKKITRRQEHIIKDYLTCHPDGVINNKILIEVKTTGMYAFKDNWGEEESGEIPVEYQLQVAHSMYLLDLQKCIMPVLIVPRRPEEMEVEGIDFEKIEKTKWVFVLNEMGFLKFYNIDRNDELISLMLSKYADFWNNNVLKGVEPPVQNYDDIKLLCPQGRGTIIASEEIERMVAERKNIQDEIGSGGALAKRGEMLKVSILDYMRKAGAVIDEESDKAFVLRSRDGKRLASYGKNKNGIITFR